MPPSETVVITRGSSERCSNGRARRVSTSGDRRFTSVSSRMLATERASKRSALVMPTMLMSTSMRP